MESDEKTYLQQLGLGVKQSFFEYFYTSEMTDEDKKEIDEKVKFAIEYLKYQLKSGFREYSNLYDENYRFIKGRKVGIEATASYYKFKRAIQKLIDFYSLRELQKILGMDDFNALLAINDLPKKTFFEYFYSQNMSVEEKKEVEEKVKFAIEYEKCLCINGYGLYRQVYDEDYKRIGIRIMSRLEKWQFLKFIDRIASLIMPYRLSDLQMMYDDLSNKPMELQVVKNT